MWLAPPRQPALLCIAALALINPGLSIIAVPVYLPLEAAARFFLGLISFPTIPA
jgi:hypothetical protein